MSLPVRRHTAALVGALVAVTTLAAGSAATAEEPTRSEAKPPGWSAGWTASMQRPSIGFEPNWSEDGFSHQSLRQIVRVTAGGSAVRIRVSNRYGPSPLELSGAAIARAGSGASVRPGSSHPLTFGRRSAVVVRAGGEVVSDAARLRVDPLESLTVTLYFRGTTGPATFHAQAFASSHRAAGDHRRDATGAAFTETTRSWYFLSGVEVLTSRVRPGSVVTFGDSITDGFGSSPDRDNRFADELAERLVALGRPRPVLNAGIGGNLVLNDSAWYGDRASTRFGHDVLDQAGVRTVIVLLGVNDIGFSESDTPTYKPNPDLPVADIIAGHRRLIRQAHARGIRVVGSTLLPMKGSDHDSPRAEAKRDALNTWIRTSGEYDAVADLDRALRSPSDPDRLRPAYDSGDHLHPNDAGYRAMAGAVDVAGL